MNKVFCSVDERLTDPLFEVFDGGDFVLSSYHDIESTKTEMQIYFPEDDRVNEARRLLEDALSVIGATARVEAVKVADEDWKFAYRRHFKTEEIGRRLVTVPTWEFDPSSDYNGRIPIVLDPGMAFGTGKHETTRACLEYIDELKPTSFLDMGCGSGILSIAAAKLGYSPVAAFDIDADAVAATKENAALNGVEIDCREFALGKGAVSLDETIEAAKGLYPDLALNAASSGPKGKTPPPAEVVVANILGPLLAAFAEEIAGYVKKTLVVSGILNDIYPEVYVAFIDLGFREVSRKTFGEWTTALLERT